MIHQYISRRHIASILLASYLAGPSIAVAQVVLNGGTPNDGRRAYVDQTQNGLPKVNIATPNGAGVSHNVYQDFNVGKQGLILNNGANNSNTSLAGWVEGNPNLTAGNEAKMILNEVVGAKQSQLQGFLEVAGKKADVIIANENGVTCNGCGFINTSRVTLSTGTPLWGSNGQLDGLKVRQGSVVVGADGLSAPDSRVDLLSQVINIQGGIHVDKINVVAGGNDIKYDDLSLTKQVDIKGTLDIATLGGMYANQIQLVATGTGVGVRVDGTLISAGNVSITSDGELINTGSINAQGQLKTQTVNLENSGTLNGQTLEVTTDKLLNLGAGTVASSGEAMVRATTLNNLGRVHTEGKTTLDVRRVNNAGVIEATGGLDVNQAWTVQNSGSLSGSNVAINTQALSNSGRVQADQFTLSAYQDSSIPNTDKLDLTAVTNSGVMAASQIAITGYGNVTNTNQISTDITQNNAAGNGDIHIQAATLDNTGGSILAKNKLAVQAGDVYNNRATLSSKGDLSIIASGNIDNGEGLILHQGAGTAQVQAGLALNNAKGQIEGQGQSITVSAGDIDNTQGQIIQTKASTGAQPATLNVTAQASSATTKGQLVNIKGKISSTGNGTVTANSIVTDASSAQLSAGSSLTFLDKSKANSGASTSTAGYNWNADIAAANAVTQAQAAADKANTEAAAKAAALQTAKDELTKLQADKTSTAAAVTQAQNTVSAAQTASDAASAAASTAAQQLAAAKAAVPVVNDGTTGTSSAQSDGKPTDLTVPDAPVIVLSTAASQIQAGNDLTLNIGTGLLDNRKGSLAAGNNLTVNAQGDVLAGQMTARQCAERDC